MTDCTVTKPFEHEGRTVKVGDSISLHSRQAEALRLQGKVKLPAAKKVKSAVAKETKADSAKKK